MLHPKVKLQTKTYSPYVSLKSLTQLSCFSLWQSTSLVVHCSE